MLLSFLPSQTTQLKRHVTLHTMKQLVSAFILSRLDYCNSVLVGLPLSTVAPLQRVQSAAARHVLGLPPCDHVCSALEKLHWLPMHIPHPVQGFKLALLMFKAYVGQCPPYVRDAVMPTSQNYRYSLCSADTTDYVVPRTRTKFRERAFCFA